VQNFGLRLLVRQDNIDAGEDRFNEVRLAMLATGKRNVEDLFPDYFPPKELEITEDSSADVLDLPGVDYDYSGIRFEMPEIDPEEEMRMLEAFMGMVAEDADPKDDPDGGWA